MTDRNHPDVIRRYLQDLYDMRAEHAETCETCIIPEKSSECMLNSIYSVEIVTYERKLAQIV